MKKLISILSLLIFLAGLYAQGLAHGGETSGGEGPLGQVGSEEYALTFFKMMNETQTKLTYMNKKSAMAKVGTETVHGDISGTLFYDVQIKGLGALVTLRYTNYCDREGWTFDGEILTRSNMSQNGTFEGTVKVRGLAPGELVYDKVALVKGNPGDGNYLVRRPGQADAEVSYKVYLKSKE
ncbi:MAG: hypothetical protein K5681_04280 [Treponema sp.]|nr:hypothetical protein [Treponema sp.]